MIALSRFGHASRLFTSIHFVCVVPIPNNTFVRIPSLAGMALVNAVKSPRRFGWPALGWRLVIALSVAYVLYFSAAWFAGGRLDTFSLKSGPDAATESCQCQPAPLEEKIGVSTAGTVNAAQLADQLPEHARPQ